MNRLRKYTGLGLCASGACCQYAHHAGMKQSFLPGRIGIGKDDDRGRLAQSLVHLHTSWRAFPGNMLRRTASRASGCLNFSIPFLYPIYEREETGMNRCYAVAMIVVLALAGAASAKAQDVAQAEKEHALQYLESSKKGVRDATKGLSDAQWNFKPAPDRWSVAQVMEHLAAAEDMIRGLAQDQVMKTPVVPIRDAEETKKADDAVLAMVPDRSHKVQAPEPLQPTKRFGSPAAAQKHFVESRANTEDYLRNSVGLRAHLGDSPLGKLDGYEYVLLIAAHSDRHTKQMLEVKADPNFPKN